MKSKYSVIGALALFAFSAAQAQEPLENDEYSRALKRNEHLQHNGRVFYANSLEDLVQSADVVVRGRWGGLIRREMYYGRGVTREEMMQRVGATEETIATYGLPTAYYEIEVDEILKGDEILLGAGALTVGRLESPETLEVVDWLKDFREGEHVFFLHESEGRTFSIPGHMFDMKLVGDAYFYRAENGLVGISGANTAAGFVEAVRGITRE